MNNTIVTYRLSPRQRLYVIGAGALIGFSQAIGDNFEFGIVLFGLFVVAYFAQARFRTELSADGIESTGSILGSKRVEWASITEVEDARMLGTHTVRLHTRDGQKIRLPAPIDGPLTRDDDFGLKLERIRAEWQKRSTAPTA